MADAAVSFAIENVGNLLIQEGKFLYGVGDEVEEMRIELKWMKCFLKDAETRKGESDMVRNWVSEIREATYDVEDLTEHFVLKSALRNQKGVMNRIKKYVFLINHAAELHQAGSRIVAIKAKLSNLRTRLQTYGIKESRLGGEEAAASGSRRKRQDYVHAVDHNVVGLDGKITELVEHLLDVKEASVVCLYGMGGLGKTTTAKKVYNDNRITTHFECFAWVYLSQQFSQREVWESILIQVSNRKKEEAEKMSEDELTSQLCILQKERKCLLVIDDIWSSHDWVKLSPAFSNLEKDSRSKILITSRNQSVALHGVYRTSLELLKNTIVFLGGPNHPLRTNLGMYKFAGKMVKQCAGLPLAIVVLGGVLATKYELQEWERVGVSIKLFLKRVEQKGNEGVEGVLESSYEDLPYRLKSCFLYFSQYREDEEIKVTELIQRWIGEGFIPSSIEEGDETIEDVAEGYLNELVSRCMVQMGKRGHTGRVKTCRMHDRMRDLCVSKAKEEGFAYTIDLRAENEGMNLEKASNRRLYILCGESRYTLGGSMLSFLGEISPQLRSALFHNFEFRVGGDQLITVALMIKKLKLVRVLELPTVDSYSTRKIRREHIGNLIHLRLLKLGFGIPKLSNLRCLQTLNLDSCSGDLEISNSVWGLEQLRHLYLPRRGGGVCESSNQRVSGLRNLQTLVNFPPKKFDLVKNLVKLTNVRKLDISSNWEDKDGILRTQEIMFDRLQSLTLWLKESGNDKYVDLQDITRSCPRLYRLVMDKRIKFPETAIAINSSIWPSNLTKLVLVETKLDERHMGTLAKLQSLKVLLLYFGAFIGKEMVFHKYDFPQLRNLLVQGMMELEVWSVHEGALPSLFYLQIIYCKKLKSVADGSQFLKHLKELRVRDMPLSFRRRVEQDWVRVSQDVPCISFSYVDRPELEKADDEIKR